MDPTRSHTFDGPGNTEQYSGRYIMYGAENRTQSASIVILNKEDENISNIQGNLCYSEVKPITLN